MVASYLDLPILDIYYIIDQKTYMFLLKAFRHIKKVLGLVISRISYPLNNAAIRDCKSDINKSCVLH